MGPKANHRKCRCCKEFFTPEHRNAYHQSYCSKAHCRRASKAASQRRWLAKPANRDHFRGKENVQRVREWRQAHPGYWKKNSSPPKPTQVVERQGHEPGRVLVTQPPQSSSTLQDVCLTDHPAFIGLISMLTESTLQEDIASTTRKLEARGRDILGLGAPAHPQTVYDCQKCPST
jgi:hypothetical protein